ncbi:UDP-glucuronic acid decarboxylase 1 [Sparganum proliferum]
MFTTEAYVDLLVRLHAEPQFEEDAVKQLTIVGGCTEKQYARLAPRYRTCPSNDFSMSRYLRKIILLCILSGIFIPAVVWPTLASDSRKIIVTGGAGFIGSHLVDRLMKQGHSVIVLDNFFTGNRLNVEHWLGHPNFQLIEHDVSRPILLEADEIYHLASPASPPNYMLNPIHTMKANILGSYNLLGLAKRTKAKFLLASTSEVYGDPEEHPQPETYWGHVNTIGPRSCYDEGKRAAESLAHAYHLKEGVQIRIARIFNTYGPRMQLNDGRVVSNFILQALSNQDISIYGDGTYTRSFQYVSDLVDGLISLMQSNVTKPVNLGNPNEFSINQLARVIRKLSNSTSRIVHLPPAVDDPKRRQPVISRAKTQLNWSPKIELAEGLQLTINAFRAELQNEANFHRLKALGIMYAQHE